MCWLILGFVQTSWADPVTVLQVKKQAYQTLFKLDANLAESVNARDFDDDQLADLLKAHLTIHDALDNPRLNQAEWQRLVKATPKEIKALLATVGYFSPKVNLQSPTATEAVFLITLNPITRVHSVNLTFKGDINLIDSAPNTESLKQDWLLPAGAAFTQNAWSDAKRTLLTSLLAQRYPNAKVETSLARIDPATQQAEITLTIDTGQSVRFGELRIQGLQHYPQSLISNINLIKPGDVYSQSALLNLQNTLQETGKFNRVEVSAATQALSDNGLADIIVTVDERKQKSASLGLGASTNTGGRVVLDYTDRNLFDRGLLWDTSLRLEQRLQAVTSTIQFLTDAKGYRDSINNSLLRTNVEGQITTAINNGVKRTWGNRSFEQFVGANLLYEFLTVDGESSQFNKSATVAYGLSLRRLDNDLIPTKGVIFSTQLQLAPIEQLSDGRFLQSQAKLQTFYPLGANTQFLGRLEVGIVNGSVSVPATYLFRAGGDQSVRGYAFQALGINTGDAIMGGRVLLTGSTELVQWFTPAWGAAAFVDFGNAANSWQDYTPAFGYGLGARWRSPVGPVGADIAYGAETKDIRLHFNLGVSF